MPAPSDAPSPGHSVAVLVVEDEPDLLASISDYLSDLGHVVDHAGDGISGLNLALHNAYDVIVLDIGLPRLDGLSLCREIRASERADVGIIMLTARDTLNDKLTGLDTGADDYLVKPFAMAELEYRIRALQRRTELNRGEILRCGELSYNLRSGEARRAGQPLKLNRTSETLLRCLMRKAPLPVSREELSRALWEDDPPDSDALKVYIHSLRLVVDQPYDRPMIETVRGKGYRILE